MRPLPLVSTLGGFVLLGLAGCGDDRSASRDESWRDWPTSTPVSDQPAGGGGATISGSSSGYQPNGGALDTRSIPASGPQPGGDVRSGDSRDYRWDTSSETTPIGGTPGISGANYGGSTVIRDNGLSFSPRDSGGGRGSSAGTQPGVASSAGPGPSPAPPGTFGLPAPGAAGRGGSSGGASTGSGVSNGSLLGGIGGVITTTESGASTTVGTGGVTVIEDGATTGVSGGVTPTGTGGAADPRPGSGTGPEQGAVIAPGTRGSGANTDPSATGATAGPGTGAAAGGMGASGGTSGGGAGMGAGGR